MNFQLLEILGTKRFFPKGFELEYNIEFAESVYLKACIVFIVFIFFYGWEANCTKTLQTD